MNPRARAFAQVQARASVRDIALVLYLKLRRLGWGTEAAWHMAQGGEWYAPPGS